MKKLMLKNILKYILLLFIILLFGSCNEYSGFSSEARMAIDSMDIEHWYGMDSGISTTEQKQWKYNLMLGESCDTAQLAWLVRNAKSCNVRLAAYRNLLVKNSISAVDVLKECIDDATHVGYRERTSFYGRKFGEVMLHINYKERNSYAKNISLRDQLDSIALNSIYQKELMWDDDYMKIIPLRQEYYKLIKRRLQNNDIYVLPALARYQSAEDIKLINDTLKKYAKVKDDRIASTLLQTVANWPHEEFKWYLKRSPFVSKQGNTHEAI